MNPAARWDYLELHDHSDVWGTEARAFAGNFLYSTGANETGFLNILDETLDRDASPAELRLRKFHEEWHDSIDPIFYEFAY